MAGNRVPPLLAGAGVRMREASTADAEFVLSLRLDPAKSRYLAPTTNDLAAQAAWMERVALEPNHRYFIVETDDGTRIGTLRLMVRPDGYFAAHSMIIAETAPAGAAVQIARIVYGFALSEGLEGGRFETRTQNKRARGFFEKIGAALVEDDGQDCHFKVDPAAMRRFLAG